MTKYSKPSVKEYQLTDGWYRREDGVYCVAPGYELTHNPLKIKHSILDTLEEMKRQTVYVTIPPRFGLPKEGD